MTTSTAPDTARPVDKTRLWFSRAGAALTLLVLAVLLVGACMRGEVPGGYTGWLLTTGMFAAVFLGYRRLTRGHPRSGRRFLAGAGATALLLGWLVSGFGAVPGYELTYRTPDAPAGWAAVRTTHRLSPYMDGNGPVTQVTVYRVPGNAKAESAEYVAVLKADGWANVGWDDYREICGGSRFRINGCAIPTYGILDAPWTHLTRDGITLTVDPTRSHTVRITALPAAPRRFLP